MSARCQAETTLGYWDGQKRRAIPTYCVLDTEHTKRGEPHQDGAGYRWQDESVEAPE